MKEEGGESEKLQNCLTSFMDDPLMVDQKRFGTYSLGSVNPRPGFTYTPMPASKNCWYSCGLEAKGRIMSTKSYIF